MPFAAPLLIALVCAPTSDASDAYTRIRLALASNDRAKVVEEFVSERFGDYLFQMAGRRRGLRNLNCKVIPVPPGWESTGKYWAVFHTLQDIEQDHDAVFPLVPTPDGLKLGREIPEHAPTDYSIKATKTDVRLSFPDRSVSIGCNLEIQPNRPRRAAVLRLQDLYALTSVSVNQKPATIVDVLDVLEEAPKEGSVLRAGSLIIPWRKDGFTSFTVSYRGSPRTADHDNFAEKYCYLTAWWIPSIARLPHTSTVRITGPKTWRLVSEGNEIAEAKAGFPSPAKPGPEEKTVTWHCAVPISYPKVVAGAYVLAAEREVDGKKIRSFQFEPVDELRAKKFLDTTADAMRFFQKHLGPYPWPTYDVYDADRYYGIESYSYTLLEKSVTTWAVPHELGHTYFGGIVPSAYVKDTWNEGLTQYIDSVAFQGNRDNSLQAGFRSMRHKVALSRMNVCWDYGSASYYRGAYVMRMLEDEIGKEIVLKGLAAMVADRVGKETLWQDVRPYMEKASKKKLDWFWPQWIDGGVFPELKTIAVTTTRDAEGPLTKVTLRQSGTGRPYRMRFAITVVSRAENKVFSVEMTQAEQTFDLRGPLVPTEVTVATYPWTLATAPQPFKISP